MNIKRSIFTALAGLALTTAACSGSADDNTLTGNTAADARPAAQQVVAQQDVETVAADTNSDAGSDSESGSGDDFSMSPEAAKTLERFDEMTRQIESAPTLAEALDLMAEAIAFLDSDPTFAGGTWQFSIDEAAPYAERYGVSVEEVLDAVRSHRVLGAMLEDGSAELTDDSTEQVSDTTVSDKTVSDKTDAGYTDESHDDEWADTFVPVFFDQALADAHTGPWADHEIGRCLGFDRTAYPDYFFVSTGGSTEGDLLMDAVVSVTAVFANEDEARKGFDDIDLCHIPESINQFLEALGIYGESPNTLGLQTHEISGDTQILTSDHSADGLPVALVAVQRGDAVVIAISFGTGVDGGLEEAYAMLG